MKNLGSQYKEIIMKLEDIEQRFKEVTGLTEIDLTKFPIKKEDYEIQSPKTNKEKSKKHGEVFTPIFLVDEMIEMDDINPNKKYLDLCAGLGQFSIRLLRALTNKYPDFDLDKFIAQKLFLNQIQKESQQKLKYIFSGKLNMYCGDAFNLKYSQNTDRGILVFNEATKRWQNELV